MFYYDHLVEIQNPRKLVSPTPKTQSVAESLKCTVHVWISSEDNSRPDVQCKKIAP